MFEAHDIGFFFYNGGGGSQDTANKVSLISTELLSLLCAWVFLRLIAPNRHLAPALSYRLLAMRSIADVITAWMPSGERPRRTLNA